MMVVKSPWCKEIRHLPTVRGEFQDDERRQFLVARNLKGSDSTAGPVDELDEWGEVGHQTSQVISKLSHLSKNVLKCQKIAYKCC